ncbi:cytochrome b/b6 domain-containing protein [Shewanella kaireitica]|uniref:cytochrome b/b6 domain-containing protein n=1 Tax=Shewanella kaireitica TaxID=212021 RepID=UPI00200E57BF|nr:cytochrome b/b6 domain-containing protein [Shewanella kaireitica]MCL1093251.1 cytochrome b/b6 domain-containing protein [Shewanella kaireitica]
MNDNLSHKTNNNKAEIGVVEYRVWDKPVRIFHWINVILITALMFIGLIMLFKPELGISGLPAKIKLKELHTIIGYLFAINLLVRLVWGFAGNHFAKFASMRPKISEVTAYKQRLKIGENPQYLGHNPIGKFAVVTIMALLVVIMVTGLMRAGTDIYYPPFGGAVTRYIAADTVDPTTIKAYDDTGVNLDKKANIKPYKSLAGDIHLYSVYLLMLLILMHVIGVIFAELRHQPGVISAMFSGKKRIAGKCEDGNE